jgi:hypothetical protein
MTVPVKTSDVIVLCWRTPSICDDSARKIAEFLGAEVAVVPVASAHEIESIRQSVSHGANLIVHADTLAAMVDALATGIDGLLDFVDSASHVFVYGCDSSDRHAAILRKLSSGGLLGLKELPSPETAFDVSDDHRGLCGQFSRLSVGTANPARDACFVEGAPKDERAVLIRAGGQPFFVRVNRGRSDVFFAACAEVGNLDDKLPSRISLLPWFSRLVPLIIFLRSALGNGLWHADRSQACFIIDDPLLKPTYGFLEYSKLQETMLRQKFSTCIAFIPWNYRRSRKDIAKLFSGPRSSLSLCVHGCDHTGAEFGATSFEILRDKARLALERMQIQEKRSRLPFDDVMVFPQGLFSSEAMKALDACGYLAAVNTDLRPLDIPQALTLRDLLDVAVTRVSGFPLFVRHYPRDVAEFAFDLFLGKPALIVEHHGYFRNGYKELESFVERLNAIDESLEWRNLAGICSRACLKKVAPGGDIHVRFYTSRFQLTNNAARSQSYVLFRHSTVDGLEPTVTLNGNSAIAERRNGHLAITLSLEPGKTAEIRIEPRVSVDAVARRWEPTSAHKARVMIRRVLSEFRDDHVETSGLLSGMLSQVRKLRARTRPVQPDFSESVN